MFSAALLIKAFETVVILSLSGNINTPVPEGTSDAPEMAACPAQDTPIFFEEPAVYLDDGDEDDNAGHEIAPLIRPAVLEPSVRRDPPRRDLRVEAQLAWVPWRLQLFMPGAWHGAEDAVGTAEAALKYDEAVSVEEARQPQREMCGAAHRE